MVSDAVREMTERLRAAGIENAAFEAQCLVEDLPTEKLAAAVDARIAGEPLQYLLGTWDFLSLRLAVGEGVLIPRQDTELLCETAAALLHDVPAPQVLDLCAAPGGKSLHAADKMRNQGCVEARDLTEYKVDLIRENVQRAGVSCVVPKVKDAEQLDAEWIGKADVVIADLPCTGYGVIGRKPDIKYYASKEKEEELVRIQRAILANAASYVKPGGTLLYSTCTVNRKENGENAAWFLEQFPFEAVSLDELLPDELKSGETAKGQLQLIPGVHKTDGFFLAKFRKTEEGRA